MRFDMSTYNQSKSRTQLARWIVCHPKLSVIASLLLMLAMLGALPQLYKDTRADAFLAADNPALIYRNKVKAQFGLSDPIVVAVINESRQGVFNPQSLQLVNWLSEEISALDNINSDRVTSLATENNISGSDDGMEVTPFFDELPETQAEADRVWQQVSDFPLYMGQLVSHDKQATLIVAELIDEDQVEQTYEDILALVERAPRTASDSNSIHVAGEGAVAGFLGSYIDADAQRLNPIAGLIITLIILFAFRRVSTALLANVIIGASVLMTLSAMALLDVPFFVITNALPVILIGIAVADSMHIFSHYFELQAKQPERDKPELIIETLEAMWRPITLTTLTTMAGFIGLYFAAYMPPFKFFGLFTAVGVGVAWLYSLVFLPAAMALIKPSASQHMRRLAQNHQLDSFAQLMVSFGRLTLNNAKTVLAVFAITVAFGLMAALNLTVNEDRIATFHPSEPLYQADRVINQHLNGTNNLDIVIESNVDEGLFEPASLLKIQALQDYALTLEHVEGATSIVDYLKQMNRSLNGGAADEYQLPRERELIAQYFLIYSASSDPTDFEEEIDFDYRVANLRLTLNKGSFQDTRLVVEQLQAYVDEHFNSDELNATLSGRVTLNYHWIKDLGKSHFAGVAISLLLVLLVSAWLFGSLTAGLYALLPVAASILIVYAAMVLLGINLGMGTSMFASVAIGLGVDFAIHTIDRLRTAFRERAQPNKPVTEEDWDKALGELYPLTGRALLFNYLAIALGFGVLTSSQVVPLTDFGAIVFISVTTSFVASLSLLPALIKVTQPQFISGAQRPEPRIFSMSKFLRTTSGLLLIGSLGLALFNQQVEANAINSEAMRFNNLSADEIVERVNRVDDGEHVSRDLTMTLIDKRGKERVRETRTYRKYYEGEKRTILFYKKPSNIKGTGFLTFDYRDVSKDDDQWLYLPALRKVRRISASDRGDYFLGTDFTYEDMMLEGKLEPADYDFSLLGHEQLTLSSGEKFDAIHMQGLPKSKVIAKELGYGRSEFWIDADTWLVVKAHYWDPKDKPLKTLEASDIQAVDNILTRHRLAIDNHKTGHRSIFEFSQVDYQSSVNDQLFSQRALKRGK